MSDELGFEVHYSPWKLTRLAGRWCASLTPK